MNDVEKDDFDEDLIKEEELDEVYDWSIIVDEGKKTLVEAIDFLL